MFKRIMRLYKLLLIPEKELSAELMKANAEEAREKALLKAARFKNLIKNPSGWNEFKEIIQEYIDDCHIRKLGKPLHMISPKELRQLELFDSDIEILKWVMQIPEQFIKTVEEDDGKQ